MTSVLELLGIILVSIIATSPIGVVCYLIDSGTLSSWFAILTIMAYVLCAVGFIIILEKEDK